MHNNMYDWGLLDFTHAALLSACNPKESSGKAIICMQKLSMDSKQHIK